MQQQGIKPETGATTIAEIKAIFEEVGAKLEEGKKYLVGDTLTAADIAFASLAAYALGQPFASYKGVPSGAPEQMKADVAALKETKAGKYALALWAEERATVLKAPEGTPSVPEGSSRPSCSHRACV